MGNKQNYNVFYAFSYSEVTLRVFCDSQGLAQGGVGSFTRYDSLVYLIMKSMGIFIGVRKRPMVRVCRVMPQGVDWVHPYDVRRLIRTLLKVKRIWG